MRTVFLVQRAPGRHWQPALPLRQQFNWTGHAAFMDALFASGYLLFGGPVPDEAGQVVLVMAADSADTVRALLAQDPWAREDVLRVSSVRAWEWYLEVSSRAAA
jgi:uncharacterized protein YciI